MYLEFNTINRKKYNSLSLVYLGNEIPKYYHEDYEDDDGAHARMVVFTNDPESTQVGRTGSQNLTGYVQIGVFLPSSDGGLNHALNDLASQVFDQYPRSNFVDGKFKVEWLNVSRPEVQRISGHYAVTMRISFTAFYC